jgi:DNA (cytosine-5)-methyltransferase 1
MARPRLLDLFCGAGGAAMGYYRAGFEVVGVDIEPQKHYPFKFIQDDAIEFLKSLLGTSDLWTVARERFAAIHASPPCQAHSALRSSWNAKPHFDLLTPCRGLIPQAGLPYVIENVPGAPIRAMWRLCGTSFGLGTGEAELRRHRYFETSLPLAFAPECVHGRRVIGVKGGHGRNRVRTIGVFGGGHGESNRNKERGGINYSAAQQREAMGIDWMTVDELSQAIPPAYTEFIGKQLMEHLS